MTEVSFLGELTLMVGSTLMVNGRFSSEFKIQLVSFTFEWKATRLSTPGPEHHHILHDVIHKSAT